MQHATINISPVVSRTLGLGPEWKIDRATIDEDLRRIDIYVSHSGKNLVCPETGESGTLYDHREERAWRHVSVMGRKCFIHCRVPRVQVSSKIKTITVPWASTLSRVTYPYECLAIEVLKETKTAELIGCSFNQVHLIMHRSVDRAMERRELGEVAHVK